MKTHMIVAVIAGLLLTSVVLLSPPASAGPMESTPQLISASSILAGLVPGALFPFIDSTPHRIVRAHIAVTDATSDCEAGAAAPSNVAVLAGVAGGTLVNVITAATNTGIGSTAQCVFHVTIKPGEGGVPSTVTDIVVVNTNSSSALSGSNTITASADVR
jgi:hypothetical protein